MTLSVKVSGNHLVDTNGKSLQLRGVNVSGLEFVTIDNAQAPPGGKAFDPWGGQKPNYTAIAAWGANAVRLPLNEQSYLSQTCYTAPTTPMLADPLGTYRATVTAEVAAANAAGLYVILDLHKNSADVLLPSGTVKQPVLSNTPAQSEMADTDNSIAFWTQVATDYKANPSVLFDLFNEPHIDNFQNPTTFAPNAGTTIPAGLNQEAEWPCAVIRDGGTGILIYGNGQTYPQQYPSAGMQAMLNAVRATGASNVCMISGPSWAQELLLWTQYAPVDPLKQIAASWHGYPSESNPAYPSFPPGTLWSQATGSYDWALSVLAAGYPIIIGETGGGVSGTLFPNLLPWADANDVSVLAWSWNVGSGWGTLVSDASGTPVSDGIAFKAWLQSHTSTGVPVSTTQNAVGTLTYASQSGFPAGSVVDHITVTVTGKATGNTTPQSQNVAPGTASVTFTNLTPDTYTYSVQGMPATGTGFGTALTGTFVITAVQTTISLSLPSGVAFTQP